MLFLFLVVIVLFCFLYYIHLNSGLNYWKDRGVKYVKPLPFVGSMLPFFTQSKNSSKFIYDLYNYFPNEKYFGFFKLSTPVLMIRDPELAKMVLIKNFDHFQNHEDILKAKSDTLWSKNLLSAEGARWKDLRQVLSPIFTSRKMKMISVLMEECAENFMNHFENLNENTIIQVEMKDAVSRYTNDVIASVAFGVQCDSLKSTENEFLQYGRTLTDFSGLNRFKFFLYGTKISNMLGLKIISTKVGNFFSSVINETIKIREERNIIRVDLIHLLMQARGGKLRLEESIEKERIGFEDSRLNSSSNKFLTNEDIAAQAIIFYFGGFDTTSNVLSFCLYELALNPEVQSELRSEIRSTLAKSATITYEALAEMKYLDNVVNETLRKWPQGVWLNRKCTKRLQIDDKLTFDVGDVVWIPVYGMQHDPKYFPNPEKFNPDRFNEENEDTVDMSAFLPFGSGPRNCIGSRFALLGIKILVVKLLDRFELVPVEKTQIPIKLRTDSPIVVPEKGIHLGLKKLQ